MHNSSVGLLNIIEHARFINEMFVFSRGQMDLTSKHIRQSSKNKIHRNLSNKKHTYQMRKRSLGMQS